MYIVGVHILESLFTAHTCIVSREIGKFDIINVKEGNLQNPFSTLVVYK